MAIRVAHVGTGNVGRLALIELITNPQFELTGVCVSTPEKVGKDAGDLAGLDVSTGIAAVNDLDALLATRPECVVYCAMGDTRLPEAMADVMRILAAGINVVGSSPGLLQYPWGVMPDKYIKRVEDAARQGNSSLFISGVDPGFVNDLIPLALASTCQSIEQVRCMEIHDYASYDGAEVMHYMGFARPMDEIPMLLQPGILEHRLGHGDQAARGRPGHRGRRDHRVLPARSGARGLRYRGRTRGQGHIGRLAVRDPRHGQRPAGDRHRAHHPVATRPAARLTAARAGGGSYRVEITGEPSYAVDIVPSSRFGDHNQAAICRRGRADRQRDSGGDRRAAGHQDDIGFALHHRKRAVRPRRSCDRLKSA